MFLENVFLIRFIVFERNNNKNEVFVEIPLFIIQNQNFEEKFCLR